MNTPFDPLDPFVWADTNSLVMSFNTFTPQCIMGPVTIDVASGAVTLREGTTLDEAAKAFWDAVSMTCPGLLAKPEVVA
jgi:hypothetical protein